jgi:hypothetical protein
MGRPWSTNEGRRGIQIGYWESQKERDQQKDHDVSAWIFIKMDLRETGWGGMDWTDLAQDRGQWRALVNTIMNLQAP